MSKKAYRRTIVTLITLIVICLFILPFTSSKYIQTINNPVTLNIAAPKYTVKFNANSGAGTMSDQEFEYGTAQNLTQNSFTKTGYTFVGWSTSSTATSGTTGSYTPTGNVTLYAIFSQNTYTLTVYKNSNYQGNGTGNETFSLAYNATKNFQDGYRANHGWGGWYWPGSYSWKNFGATVYCATVWSNGQNRAPLQIGMKTDGKNPVPTRTVFYI